MKYKNIKNKLIDIKQKAKKQLLSYIIMLQQLQGGYEKLLLQQQVHLFADNSIIDFYFEGLNKHILISDNFDAPNLKVMINPNGYISITDDASIVWYQVTSESPTQLPNARPILDFKWSEFDVDSIINSFTSEADLHRFKELLKVEVSTLKQRLWLFKNSKLKLELIEDEKLLQELSALMEVA